MTAHTEAKNLLATLRLEDGRRWGDAAEPWQWDDAAAVLAPDPPESQRPSRWRRRQTAGDYPRWHYWLRGRGMSKTTDAAAVLLALLVTLAPPRSRSYVYAADGQQAGLLLDALAGLAERSGLLGRVEIRARSVIVKATGASLSIEASDAASAFGTRPWLVVVDEFAMWGETDNFRRLWSSIVSGLAKVPGSRLLVLSSAGSPGSLAHKQWVSAEKSPHWRTSCTPGPSPWWSAADIEATRADTMPAEWDRLILCKWVAGDEALVVAEDLTACTGSYRVREPEPGVRYCMGLDIGTRRDATVLVVGHTEATPAGRTVVIDRVQRWRGSRLSPVSLSDVEVAIVRTCQQYHRPKLVFDPFQAAQLTERLRTAGVRTEEFTFTTGSVNSLARSLFGALRDRAIVLPDDDELLDELASVRLVETGPGLVRLDHNRSGHDDQAVAIALVVLELTRLGPEGGRPVIFDDAYLRASAVADLQARGEAPKPVQLIGGRGFGSVEGTGFPDSVIREEWPDDDAPAPGATRRSPFA
jgi:hypothetical protein